MGKGWVWNHDDSADNLCNWGKSNVFDDKKEKTDKLHICGAFLLVSVIDNYSAVFWRTIQRYGRDGANHLMRQCSSLLIGIERGEGEESDFTKNRNRKEIII